MMVLRDTSIGLPSPDATASRPFGRSTRLRFLGRLRYQLVGGALVAVLLPGIVRTGLDPAIFAATSARNTFIGTLIAMLLGVYLLRRMTKYPDVRAISFLLPAFSISYGLVVGLFFFARFDYSRFQFLSSFVLALIWFGFVGLLSARMRRPRLLWLPFGQTADLAAMPQADWVLASTAEELPRGLNGIVADLRADMGAEWEQFLARAALAGIPVYHSKQIREFFTGRVRIEHLSENTFGSLLPSSIYLRVKRVLDIWGAIIALPLALVILAVGAIAIRLEDGGPVLFKQRRMGYRGKSFVMLKFRTMRDGVAGKAFTEENDPRITKVGRILRRYRIDELPQIFNVLKGEMSWIGPRPESTELATRYGKAIPFYAYRHIVRPGITGWAQVNQGNVAEVAAATEKLHYDFFYIKYFSPWLDFLVMARTIRTVMTGRGAR